MTKIRCLSRYRLQASDPRRKKVVPLRMEKMGFGGLLMKS